MNKDSVPKNWFEKKYINNDGSFGYLRLRKEASNRIHHQFALDAISQFAPRCDFDSVIDIGCACADFTDIVSSKFKISRAVGMDFVASGMEIGKARYPYIEFILASLPKIPSSDSSFDLVLAMEVLYYLSKQDLEESVKEIKRVASPGGVIVVSVSLGDDTNKLNRKEIMSLFDSGFRLCGIVDQHAKIQAGFNKNMGRFIRVAKKYKIPLASSAGLFLRDNMIIAQFNYKLSKLIFGSSAVTKQIFVFEKTD